ncbi:cupredoxin domain-containing protein [Zeimonas arvi]|uniref:Blue (type 1) copper domain-containing protein n=1 Tax=Zeimonas arvi TaxID=2498847 RepID=A0A5C8P5G6_9BURK|nr:cupredoxin family protein [Zeimonas arvi]TXL68770.1 hypothetical protein FHP08_03575 [Zeimonas arvi]
MKFHTPILAALFGSALLAAAPGASAHGSSHDASHGQKALEVVETAFGRTGDPSKAARTIRIDMSDTMRFSPDAIQVRRGETVSFEIANAGRVLHEMVIGTEAELKAHAEMMKKFPGMEHEEPYMAHVDPGKSGRIVWQFTKPGEYRFACLIPGHFEAGMVGRITVTE